MPKKKPQHKRQNKVSGDDESFNEEKLKIKDYEEYETVVDYEQSGKFSKRRLECNWAKYDTPLSSTEFDVEDEESTGIYDYNFLVENASSDFSHFEFAFEKSRKETKPIINNSIFKLDLNVLSSGLACIPFYERIGLDEEKISDEDKKRCDEEAKRNWEKYKIIRESFNKNNLEESKIKKCNEEKNVELSLNSDFKKDISDFTFFPQNNFQSLEASETNPTVENATNIKLVEKPGKKEENIEDWLDKALLLSNEDNILGEGSEEKKKQKGINEGIAQQELKDETQSSSKTKIFSDTGENLEDWLDSVLDD